MTTIGFVQTIGAMIFAVQLIDSDRNGGLFGFRVGALMVLFVCVPLAISGTLEMVGGVGAMLRKRWGYVTSLLAAALNMSGALLALLFSATNMGSGSMPVVAVAMLVIALNVTVLVSMLRALAATR